MDDFSTKDHGGIEHDPPEGAANLAEGFAAYISYIVDAIGPDEVDRWARDDFAAECRAGDDLAMALELLDYVPDGLGLSVPGVVVHTAMAIPSDVEYAEVGRIAGHRFNQPGDKCECGKRFTDISWTTPKEIGTYGIAHTGSLTETEYREIEAARNRFLEAAAT